MSTQRSTATPGGRSADAHGALLTRIQQELAAARPATSTRRCPCCGGPIRAGQRITTIHGTSVHALCTSTRR